MYSRLLAERPGVLRARDVPWYYRGARLSMFVALVVTTEVDERRQCVD